MKEFLEFLIKSIVTLPEKVKVEELVDKSGSKITISVEKEDMGTVIGKGGKIIKSVRSLARAKAIKDGTRVFVELAEC
ncbi:MAG: hypothetical protein UX44_C0022G0006 [candidate division WWE3 bacterium GW2011_GWA1_46_21]|uniref:RNA-binding protein KhpA n=4 Tax=Katanobacteria TaxID=422282 RepID=A0A0G1RKB5_UNCKA|nr:MAG: hypothetical protein UX44_C0022G0006 [candidate division WWE3 bacterium GW2011_GWA1_46_21]KKU49079.1 MAG: hypothetical protein UX69_C0006G0007 [candidate division WWE3 bacterium GW2011_GWA2_46_9]KKU51118.1 MAG: hypothetical protein UX73_C0007G0010 [candidate division WWE3 bacterium GW2011_GWC1_47_10]KKU57503.1 MAG: hypothetical protein UX79_C0010G0010 [candidate division WWE3 bacterium GW2011_GWB1_47_11]